jgi:hypothetical protein
MDAKAKLKQQLQAKRLKRGGPQAQRTFLEKQKVPEELIDSCMNRMKGGSNNIQSLMNQMSQLKQMTAAVTAASASASASATTSTTSANSSATVEDSASATAFASAVASSIIPDTPSPSPIVTNTEPQPASELKL